MENLFRSSVAFLDVLIPLYNESFYYLGRVKLLGWSLIILMISSLILLHSLKRASMLMHTKLNICALIKQVTSPH